MTDKTIFTPPLQLDTILNMDCVEGLKMIPDGSIDLIVTDPPYEVMCEGGGGTVNSKKGLDKSLQALKDANIHEGYDIEAFAVEVARVQGDINAYFWCNKLQIPKYFEIYVGKYGCKFDILTWHKINALPTYSNKYLSDTEFCLYFHNGKGQTFPKTYEDAMTFTVGQINATDKKVWKHPTIKPINLLAKLIRNSSREGGVILDPFMGSGTTAVAAIKENRHYLGFELNPEYHKIALERVKAEQQQLTLF